jgi:23S rRNA (guanine745-N1)-methyltransferase
MKAQPDGQPGVALWRRLADVVSCPVCGASLRPEASTLRCAAGHCFDIARHGYVSLLAGRPPRTADTARMVAARAAFLAAGHYAPLAAELSALAARLCPADGILAEAGAGTGYYLASALAGLPGAAGLALDSSGYALRRAARAHPRLAAAACDIWQALPVRSGSADLLLNIFAPRNGAEFRRVLRPDGALIVVTPAASHLAELRDLPGMLSVDPVKRLRTSRALSAYFSAQQPVELGYQMELSGTDVASVLAMGPSAHHGGVSTELTGSLRVSAAFELTVYRPRRSGSGQ